jgi:outer membrane murein-binding lipoprotein Lpp
MDIDGKLEEALKRREKLSSLAQRIQGQKEAADRNVAAVEDEIRAMGIEPSDLGAKVKALEEALASEVETFNNKLDQLEADLKPYTEKIR